MAYIDKTNAVNGNTIQATDVTNIVDALDGTTTTSILILGDLAQGSLNTTNGTDSHAEGSGSQATGLYSHAEGRLTQATGDYSHAEGNTTLASGEYTHAEGSNTIAIGTGSHAEGDTTQAVGTNSHAEGFTSITSGSYSHAEGNNTIAIGDDSHAEGQITKTGIQTAYYATSVSSGVITLSGSYSDVSADFTAGNRLFLYDEIFDNNYGRAIYIIAQSLYVAPNTLITLTDNSVTTTTAYVGDITYGMGNWVGDQTIPGNGAHTEGSGTITLGLTSHAEGLETQTIGNSSHAEGSGTITLGDYSHAEGSSTQAIGDYSHAEGTNTQAIGDNSHAEGDTTIALGNYSFTAGKETVASGSYQFVVGQKNTDGDDTSLFIVGGGLQDVRLDAFKVTHSSSILIPQTQSAAPSWSGSDGEIIPVTDSGVHYLYMWMSGAWRSSSFA